MYLNKAAKVRLISQIGELAWLASAKDIGTALVIGQQMCQTAGIDWQDVPELVEISKL